MQRLLYAASTGDISRMAQMPRACISSMKFVAAHARENTKIITLSKEVRNEKGRHEDRGPEKGEGHPPQHGPIGWPP